MLHPKVIIHLDRLEQNIQAIRSIAGEERKIMAVVKNEAYGHGQVPVARFLADKADWFCVARIEEGVRLREEGIENPILVFEVPQAEYASLYTEHDLTALISDLSHFDLLDRDTHCHLQFDTGMMRLGILPEEADAALQKFHQAKHLKISGICTHFANSDVPEDPMNARQLEIFREIRSRFPDRLFTHVANSGGVFYHQDKSCLFDGVRPGISLYGYEAGEEKIPELKPVMELRSHLIQVKKIKKGEKVGYGSTWRAKEEGRIGIIPVGYAHGIPRVLSNLIKVKIDAKLYPQVGTISMDYMAVNLGKEKAEVGTEVTILGDGELSANSWASKANTISYEITTHIAAFIQREYV